MCCLQVIHAKSIYLIVCIHLSIQCLTGARGPPACAWRLPTDPNVAEPSSAVTHDTILTITNTDCSKASIFLPCSESIDSEGVALLYATHMIPHYGIPHKVISDWDVRFTSKFTIELCHLLDIHQNIRQHITLRPMESAKEPIRPLNNTCESSVACNKITGMNGSPSLSTQRTLGHPLRWRKHHLTY